MNFANGTAFNIRGDRPLVVLSHGMGQDSAAMLALLTDHDQPEVAQRYIGGAELLVIHADTGNEHAATVAYRDWVRTCCAARGIAYFQVDRDLGFHSGAWRGGLHGQWDAHGTINSVAFGSTCSDQLKIEPIWRAVNALLAEAFGIEPDRRAGLREHVARFGKRVDCLIGFGRGEEHRLDSEARTTIQPTLLPPDVMKTRTRRKWFGETVRRIYPLIDLRVDRLDAQRYLRSRALPVPPPSLCRTCHWSDEAKVLHLSRTDPDTWSYWVEAEARKLREHPGKERNLGVKGAILLPAFLERAQRLYGNLSTDELYERVFSHGQCVRSNF